MVTAMVMAIVITRTIIRIVFMVVTTLLPIIRHPGANTHKHIIGMMINEWLQPLLV